MDSSAETPKRDKPVAGTLDPKGKARMSPEYSPEREDGCGICLSEIHGSVRGAIDCCDHFFCFVCIMEWARIESRCPLCKQRFRSIRRPPVTGVFAVERVVRVPERNQASDPNGDDPDPYAHVCCTLCHSSAKEELLLLCDLCDSAAHTFCIGLGATVPDGDWYCPDCAVLREASQCNTDPFSKEFESTTGSFGGGSDFVSVYEIVADEYSESSRGTSTADIKHQDNDNSPVRNPTHKDTPDITAEANNSGSTAGQAVSSSHGQQNEIGARTLRNCRNLHGRIRVLRDNWTSLRSGSLAFSSELFRHNAKKVEKRKSNFLSSGPVVTKQQEQTPPLSKQETVLDKSQGKADGAAELQDINKAWKHMEVVWALKEKQMNNKSSGSCGYSSKLNLVKGAECHLSSSHACHIDNASPASGANSSKHTPKMQLKYDSLRCTREVNTQMGKLEGLDRGSPNVALPVNLKPSSAKIVCSLPKQDTSRKNKELSSEHAKYKTPTSSDFHVISVSSSSISCSLPAKNPSNFASKLQAVDRMHDLIRSADERLLVSNESGQENSSTLLHTPGKLNLHNSDRKQYLNNQKDGSSLPISKKPRYSNASNKSKEEVQYLVKLNLSLLNKNRNIGSDKFKEVARTATHTILAACGLEHSKSIAQSFSTSVCKHSDQFDTLRKSNLMPNSCRECFYNFVRTVVESLMS